MICALLMAFQVVQTRHALQSQTLPVDGSRQPPHNHSPWKGARTSTLGSPQQGRPVRTHLTLLWEKQQPEAPGQGTDRAYVTTQMVPNLA